MESETRAPTAAHGHESSSTITTTTSDLTDAVKIAIAYNGSPLTPYRQMDGDECSSVKSFNSSLSMGKRFTCQFDPGAKNGRSLVRCA